MAGVGSTSNLNHTKCWHKATRTTLAADLESESNAAVAKQVVAKQVVANQMLRLLSKWLRRKKKRGDNTKPRPGKLLRKKATFDVRESVFWGGGWGGGGERERENRAALAAGLDSGLAAPASQPARASRSLASSVTRREPFASGRSIQADKQLDAAAPSTSTLDPPPSSPPPALLISAPLSLLHTQEAALSIAPSVHSAVRDRVHGQRCSSIAPSAWTEFTVWTGKESEHLRGMPLVTRLLASSEQAWRPTATSSVNFCLKRARTRCTSIKQRSRVPFNPGRIAGCSAATFCRSHGLGCIGQHSRH
jgi:hypothetical protein